MKDRANSDFWMLKCEYMYTNRGTQSLKYNWVNFKDVNIDYFIETFLKIGPTLGTIWQFIKFEILS